MVAHSSKFHNPHAQRHINNLAGMRDHHTRRPNTDSRQRFPRISGRLERQRHQSPMAHSPQRMKNRSSWIETRPSMFPVNSEKLLALQGFEEWANEEGFVKIFCHWSTHNSRIAYGTEGILILTKISCKTTYAIGDPQLDAQARVVTLEFPKFFILISYNPQGWVREESLNFRSR